MGRAATRFLVIGNVTEDLDPSGAWVPGGPSLYAARTAAGLGADVTLAAGIPAEYDRGPLEGLDVRSWPVPSACRYQNVYNGGRRSQRLAAPGSPIAMTELAARFHGERFDVVLVAPAFQELAAMPEVDAATRGVSLQGVFRTVHCGEVRPSPRPLSLALPFALPSVLLFFSEEDVAGQDADALASSLSASGSIVVVTRGERGASAFLPGREAAHFNALESSMVEPTGAGDAFATAFTMRWHETLDLSEAMMFALAAGALAIERTGVTGMPTRAEVEFRAKAAGSV